MPKNLGRVWIFVIFSLIRDRPGHAESEKMPRSIDRVNPSNSFIYFAIKVNYAVSSISFGF